jgi:hypothetical protein
MISWEPARTARLHASVSILQCDALVARLLNELTSVLLGNPPLVHREATGDNIKIEDSCLWGCDILHCTVFHAEPVATEKHDTSIFNIEIIYTLMMVTTCSSETLISNYNTTSSHNSEDLNLNIHWLENLKTCNINIEERGVLGC